MQIVVINQHSEFFVEAGDSKARSVLDRWWSDKCSASGQAMEGSLGLAEASTAVASPSRVVHVTLILASRAVALACPASLASLVGLAVSD